MALGVPRRAFIRRKKAPKALCEWCTLRAARRRATVTRGAPGRTRRDSTFPPEILCWGHSPNQRQKCFTLGHRVISVPISERITRAVPSSMPSMVVRSTPAMRESGVRASEPGCVGLLVAAGLGGQGVAVAVIRKGLQMGCDLLIAEGELRVRECIERDGLL